MTSPKISEKQWDKAFEAPVIAKWKKEQPYRFDPDTKKLVFSIDTPPPYVNNPVHIGQATTYVLMDFFARYKRMTGHEVLFPLGLDNNGLPIEIAAERRYGIDPAKTPREDFLKKCREMLEESGLESLDSFYRAGIGFCSWEKGTGLGEIYETDSPAYRALTQNTFIDLWNKGLIYEDERVNNYDPKLQTTIADAEVEYAEKETLFNDIAFSCKETGEKLVIGTTRPEFVCTCGMVIYNPEDERYQHLEGKTALSPIFNREIPIKAHPAAQMDKGTGLVMMCSFGDLTDIRFFREQNLAPVIAIEKDGTMNAHAGFLKGLPVKEARAKMIEALREKGLLVKQKKVMHKTPVSERSKADIEFVAMKEFYVKQLDFKKDMERLAKEMHFFAPESRQILLDWIDAVSIDWPISRRRFYATEVPLWYCKKCGFVQVPPKGKYYRPWKEKPPVQKCEKCGAGEWRGDERVFDTWFDSSISPLYILGYERHPEFFKKAKGQATLRPQGKEIVRTWLYYTVLKCFLLTKKPIFRDVWVNYHIVDEKGNKMSKSVGNVINPHDVLEKHGAEAFRLWSALEGNLEKTDFKCSFERIEGNAKTLSKLWNASRYISMFEKPKSFKMADVKNPLDLMVLGEINRIAGYCNEQYAKYDFHNPAVELRNFLWETFASHYLENAKPRAYNRDGDFEKKEQDSALFTLHYCLETMLKLWAPILPIITAKIYEELLQKDVHFEDFPKAQKVKEGVDKSALMEANSAIWKAKRDAGLALNAEVKSITVPKALEGAKSDLAKCHRAQTVLFGDRAQIEA